MKPKYNPFTMMWEVKGAGTYATLAEAREATGKLKKSCHVSCCLSEDVKARLQIMADDKKLSLSAMARKLIEKGVSDYGKRQDG